MNVSMKSMTTCSLSSSSRTRRIFSPFDWESNHVNRKLHTIDERWRPFNLKIHRMFYSLIGSLIMIKNLNECLYPIVHHTLMHIMEYIVNILAIVLSARREREKKVIDENCQRDQLGNQWILRLFFLFFLPRW